MSNQPVPEATRRYVPTWLFYVGLLSLLLFSIWLFREVFQRFDEYIFQHDSPLVRVSIGLSLIVATITAIFLSATVLLVALTCWQDRKSVYTVLCENGKTFTGLWFRLVVMIIAGLILFPMAIIVGGVIGNMFWMCGLGALFYMVGGSIPRAIIVGSAFIAVNLLLLALADMTYGYYTFLRWAICTFSIFIALLAYRGRNQVWLAIFTVIAAVFNPVWPIHFPRVIWAAIDIAAALALGFFAVNVQSLRPTRTETMDDGISP